MTAAMMLSRCAATVPCAVAIVMLLAGCSTPPAETAALFVTAATDAGYRCVETTPPSSDVDLLRSCQDDAGSSVSFTAFVSEDSRRRGELGADVEQAVVACDGWLVVGDDKRLVASIGRVLGVTDP